MSTSVQKYTRNLLSSKTLIYIQQDTKLIAGADCGQEESRSGKLQSENTRRRAADKSNNCFGFYLEKLKHSIKSYICS